MENNIYENGTPVLSSNDNEIGKTTGITKHCQMHGCTGHRIGVRWPDNKITWPCSKGMTWNDNLKQWEIRF